VPTGVFNVIVPTSQVGDPLPYSPKYRAVLTGTYTLPVPDTLGTVEFAATYAFQSSLPTLASYIPNSRQDATNLVNLNLNWLGIAGGPVDASFFVTNLLDEVYTVADSGVLNSPGGGYDSRLRGQPRMFGGRLRLRFGSDARS
jgi:iron complex outermembrane receptor protein